jgi:hypothetical protein
VKWSDRSSAASLLLDGRPLEEGSFEATNAKVFREVDGILAEGAGSTAIQQKPSLSQQLLSSGHSSSPSHSTSGFSTTEKSNRYGVGSNTDIFDMEKPIALPLSHPAHQFQASQFFGVAATKEILLMNNSGGKTLEAQTRQGIENLHEKAAGSSRDLFAGMDASSTSVSSASDDRGFDRRLSHSGFDRRNSLDRRPSTEMYSGGEAQLSGPLVSNPHESLPVSHTEMMAAAAAADRRPMTQGQKEHARDTYVSPSNYDTLPTRSDASHSTTFPSGAGVFGLPSGVSSLTVPGVAGEPVQGEANMKEAGKERVELATKYLYIHGLLEKMISSAQLSYQVSLQLESLRKRLKPKRTQGLSQEQVQEMRSMYNQKHLVLTDSRELFLKSRLTLQWFYRDFELNYGLHLLHDAEVMTRRERAMYETTGYEVQQTEYHSFGSGLPSAQEQANLAHYDKTLAAIEGRRTALELRLMANERYALSIAHYYLSKHSAGSGLTMQDAPDLDPSFFSLLDVSHTHRVSREELHQGLIRLAEAMDSLNARIMALRIHNQSIEEGTARGGQNMNVKSANETKIQRLEVELGETRRKLHQLHSFFLQTFTRNVFVNVDPSSLEAETIDARGLRSDLSSLTSSRKAVNPLDLANEGVVGPDETVRQENVGSGLPVEHVAGKVEVEEEKYEERVQVKEEIRQSPEIAKESFSERNQQSSFEPRTANPRVTEAVEQWKRDSGMWNAAPFASSSVEGLSTSTGVLIHFQEHEKQPVQAEKVEERLAMETGLLSPTKSQMLWSKANKPLPQAPMPTVSQLVARINSKDNEFNTNSHLAKRLHPSMLQRHAETLRHVPKQDIRESIFGGLHSSEFPLIDSVEATPLADILLATAVHAPAMAHQLTPIAEVITPSPFGGQHDKMADLSPVDEFGNSFSLQYSDSPRNAALAALVKERELKRAEMTLDHPSGLRRFRNGSVHTVTALLDLPIDSRDLKHTAVNLRHVSWKKAQRTMSGGMHALTKANVRVIPEAIYAPGIDAATNSPLARIIQPGQLKSEKSALTKVTNIRDSGYGGRHDNNADLGYIDAEELNQSHDQLHHIRLDRATPTLGGGLHTVAKPDTTVVPDNVLDAEAPSNAPLAAVVTESALRSEKRHLDHVPIELQRNTMSGGVHMNDKSATLHPTLMERVKTFVGLDSGPDTTAPELGKVVAHSSPRKSPRTLPLARRPAPSAFTFSEGRTGAAAPTAAVLQQQGQVPFPQNAVLAQKVKPAALQQEAKELTPATAVHGALAPIVGESQLIMQRRELHHVSIDRIELKRDLAAGVGCVTTRKATPRRRIVEQPHHEHVAHERELPAHHGEPGDANFEFEKTSPAHIQQPDHAIPSPRLPQVVGRSVGASSRASSPAGRVVLAEQKPVYAQEQWTKNSVAPLDDSAKERATFDPRLANEQNVVINMTRPMHQTMPMQ